MVERRVQRALDLDWRRPGDLVHVLGVELRGAVVVPLGEHRTLLRFRADRADVVDKRLRLTDYKTGRRPQQFARDVDAGERLQGAAYARCADAGGRDASGRYLFVHEEVEDRFAAVELRRDDAFVADGFPRVAAALWHAIADGRFFPRVEDEYGKEPDACRWCAVAAACTRGDSTWRRRLREAGRHGDPQLTALWRRTLVARDDAAEAEA
jgi:hypothetical protein